MTEQAETTRAIRKLTPNQAAERLGVGVRVVQLWISQEGAPATRVPRGGRGGDRLYINLDELTAWCHANGKPIGAPELAGDGVVADLGEDDGMPLLGASSPRTQAELIEKLRAQIARMSGKLGTAEAAEAQKLSGSIEKLSNEVRRLESDERERQREAGVWMRREAAEAVLVAVARRVREGVQRVPLEGAALVLAEVLEKQADPRADGAAFERVVASALAGLIERVLGGVADDVAVAGQDLARAG